jgi:hypothetical protein
VGKGAKRRAHAFPAIQPRGLRCAQPTLQFVTTGLDPVVHADWPAAWIAGSFGIKTALRAFCPAMTGSERRHDLSDLVRIFAGISGPAAENALVDLLQIPPLRRQRLRCFVKI